MKSMNVRMMAVHLSLHLRCFSVAKSSTRSLAAEFHTREMFTGICLRKDVELGAPSVTVMAEKLFVAKISSKHGAMISKDKVSLINDT